MSNILIDTSGLFSSDDSDVEEPACNFNLGFRTDEISSEDDDFLFATVANILPSDDKQIPTVYDSENINNAKVNEQRKQTKAPTFVNIAENQNQQKEFVTSMKNENTVRKTESVMNIFHTFLESPPNNELRRAEDIPSTELNNYVGGFLLSIRKSDGQDYEPDTLTSYHRGIDRYLREKEYNFSLVSSAEFRTSRDVLMSKRKELKQKGKGNRPNKSTPLSESEQKKLKEEGAIGCSSPSSLQNQIWLNNTMHFGLRGRDENRKLKWGDITLKEDERGVEYLEFNERDTKTRTGENINGHQRAFKPKQFALANNKEDCPVVQYKIFKLHRPQNTCESESPFYLSVNHKRKPQNKTWYKNQAMGKNTLNNIMKTIAKRGKLVNRKTNHSARSTTATRLLHAGVAPTTIAQLTGHKNISSLNNYAVASHNQQAEISQILSLHPQPRPSTSTESPNTSVHSSTGNVGIFQGGNSCHSSNINVQTHTSATHTGTAAGIFQGATFNGCTFNMNFPSV